MTLKPLSLIHLILAITAAALLPAHAPAREVLTNKLGMNFVLVPAGSFIMGSPKNEKGRNWNETQHRVIISKSFWMGETEVTQGQWNRLVSPNPSVHKQGSAYPVDSVSWHDAVRFIAFLNQYEGTQKYRLPTEAEWEYACRAGSKSALSLGPVTTFSCNRPEPALINTAWYCYNSGLTGPARDFKPHPVKQLTPNAWGLYDMHGNVQEWVQDACKWRSILKGRVGVITSTYVNNIRDPLETEGDHRVIRGGGWHQNSKYQRSAYRSYYKPVARRNSLGFRVVKEK